MQFSPLSTRLPNIERVHILDSSDNILSAYNIHSYLEKTSSIFTGTNYYYNIINDKPQTDLAESHYILFQSTDENKFLEYLNQYKSIQNL